MSREKLMNREKELEAVLTIAAALLVISLLFNIQVIIPVVLGLCIVSILSKLLTSKLIWLWFKLAEGLGFISSKILLSIIFFVFLFPISVLYRLFNEDALGLKRKESGSYFTERDHWYSPDNLKNPW